jgi:diguanylate cyclase (GGDEF)-like protein/PAS domain S-box-containing protein
MTDRRWTEVEAGGSAAGILLFDQEVEEQQKTQVNPRQLSMVQHLREIIPFDSKSVRWDSLPPTSIAGVIGVSRDITERKAAEAALRQSDLLHRSVLEASADCICILDCDGIIQLMNSPGQRAFELDGPEGVVGRDLEALWPAAGRKLVRAALRDARKGQIARFSGCCPTAQGNPKWWDVLVTPMCDEDGEVTRLLAISRDISAQRDSAERLKWASEHDALTSLPNRRAFQARLQAAALRAMQSSGTVGLLLIDLDHFKHVNDTMGHAAGDHLLKSFAQRLRAGVRGSDFVARLGGDEFAVILEGTFDEDDLVQTGASILARLKDPIRYDGRVMSAGASIGGALFPRHAQTANELFNNADTALYALKESGRGGTKMFHQHMRERAQKVASQLSLARLAISDGSVEPHYQPKVEVETGRIVGFEALLRWRHPSHGLQLPDTVLEAFKDYELAAKIGDLMQRRVFADIAGWMKDGVDAGVVAINAAPAEFLRDDFAERLLARLHEHAVPPSRGRGDRARLLRPGLRLRQPSPRRSQRSGNSDRAR